MLKSCKYCGKIHDAKYVCNLKPKKEYQIKTDEISGFRSSYKWQLKREQIRQRDMYLCQVCLNGLYGAKHMYQYKHIEVHHIVPINENNDLKLEDNNLICLCDYHHRMADNGYISRYLLQSLINKEVINMKLNVVYGSPCSGKTTYVKSHMKEGDIVIDYDYIYQALTLRDKLHKYDNNNSSINQLAMDIKQFILNQSISNSNQTVWLITTTMNEYINRYSEVNIITMDKTKEEVLEMLYKDKERTNKDEWRIKIEKWYEDQDIPPTPVS